MKLLKKLTLWLLAWSSIAVCGEPAPESWFIPTPKTLKRTKAVSFKGSEYRLIDHAGVAPEKLAEFRRFLKEKMNWVSGETGNIRIETGYLEKPHPNPEYYTLDIRENQVRELKKFCKSEFDIDSIFSTASELKYVHEFKNQFAEQVENPSDELTRLFLQGCYTGQKTQAVIEKFRPLLKKALNDYISETMNDKIKNALGGSGGSVSVSEKPTAEPVGAEKDADVSDSNESKIVTTEEELEAYFIIKNLLKDVVDLQDITYKDTESYINILYKKNTRKWICRLKLTDTVKTLIVPDEEKKGQKFNLTSVYDLEQYNDLLHKILARYM